MLTASNKIIIVDNEKDHLTTLGNQFFNRGIGCTLLEYDDFYDTPLNGVRLAFFDINLKPSGGASESQTISIIANALKLYIGKENGPYALVFWTQNEDLIEKIKKYISEREPDIPKPIIIDVIDKHLFLEKAQSESLKSKLEILLSDKTIELLFDFEKKIGIAASEVLKDVFKIVPTNDNWGETTEYLKNFDKVFSKIAQSTLGFEHAQNETDFAIYSALLPMLEYNINKEDNGTKWKDYLNELGKATKEKDLEYPKNFRESELNSVFHILKNDRFDKGRRGAVIELSTKFENLQYFIGIPFKDWFDTFITLAPGKKNANIKINVDTKNQSKLIAIEISAACDFSQNKFRFNKYILGVIVPMIGATTKPNGSSSIRLGKFYLEEEFEIWLNMSFVIGTTPENPLFREVLFALKDSVTNQIGNRYANHISRIGITSF